MKTIVITGGVGSGKTFTSHTFNALHDVPVFYTDTVAKYIMNNDENVKKQISSIVGENAYKNGTLNHKVMGDVIFNQEEIRKSVEAVVHPLVTEKYMHFKKANSGSKYCLFECANFFELLESHNIVLDYDLVIGVSADISLRKSRVIKRSGWTPEKIESVMNLQISQEDLIKRCDIIIENSQENLISQVNTVHNSILEMCN